MVQNYTVWVEKKAYPVVVSDERKALLAAKAAGRAFVGLIHLEEYGGGSQKEERTEKSQTSELLRTENQPVEKAAEGKTANDIWDAEYLATPDAICPEYLERIVRRHIGPLAHPGIYHGRYCRDARGAGCLVHTGRTGSRPGLLRCRKIEGLYQRPVPLL